MRKNSLKKILIQNKKTYITILKLKLGINLEYNAKIPTILFCTNISVSIFDSNQLIRVKKKPSYRLNRFSYTKSPLHLE